MEKKNNVRKSGYTFEYRITILGDKKTGKSSLLSRYTNDTFTHRYLPTIEEHVTHIVQHKGDVCVCLFIDTCGGNDFPAMRRLEISKGNAFFVLYAINDRKTFEMAKSILSEIKSLKAEVEDLKIILIGNKTDLEEERVIQTHEGYDLLQMLNEGHIHSHFFEVSAKNNENVDSVFESLLDMYIQKERISEDISSSKSRKIRKKNGERRIPKQPNLDSFVSSITDSHLNLSAAPLPGDSQCVPKSVSNGSSPNLNIHPEKKTSPHSPAIYFIQKTLGNLHRKFSGNSREGLVRSNTIDSSMCSNHKW